MFKKDRGK